MALTLRSSRIPQFLGLILLVSLHANADTLHGRVVGVSDGDTITLLDASNNQYKVRLAGIDAPEKAQPYGQQSKQSLSDLVYGHEVVIEWNKRDRYGRIVGKVLVNDVDADLEQIRRGLAWHYKEYEKEQSPEDRAIYADAELEARNQKVGVWAQPEPTSPWEWRHRSRQ